MGQEMVVTPEGENKIQRDCILSMISAKSAFEIGLTAGELRTHEFYKNVAIIQQVRLIERFHADQKYKQIEGVKNWEEFCALIGVSRGTSYRILEAIEKAGPEFVELALRAGITIGEQVLFLKAGGEIEDIGFEVLDSEAGTVRVGGKEMRVQDEPDIVTSAIKRALNILRMQSAAVKGLEADLEKKGEDVKRLGEKVKNGEVQVRELREKVKEAADSATKRIRLSSPIATQLMNLSLTVAALEKEEFGEGDGKHADKYLDTVDELHERLLRKFATLLPGDKE